MLSTEEPDSANVRFITLDLSNFGVLTGVNVDDRNFFHDSRLWPIGGEDPIGPAPTALKDFAIRVASGFCDLENVA